MDAPEDTATTMAATTLDGQLAALQPDVVPGRYDVDVSGDWNCPVVPQGGLMAALAAKAMAMELAMSNGDGDGHGDPMALRSLTTVFAAPVPDGPVTIDVRVLRRGRSMSQAMATVRSPGAEAGHTAMAVFGRRRPGFEFTDRAMPDVPGPLDCPSFRDPVPRGVEFVRRPEFPFWHMVEGRPAHGHAPWDDYEPTSSDSMLWYRLDDLPWRGDGSLDPLALVVYSDTMPGAVRERMGPGQREWYPPSADLTVHLLGEPRSEWILGHSRASRAQDGYAALEMDLWDPAVGLVARSCQIMFFVFPPTGS